MNIDEVSGWIDKVEAFVPEIALELENLLIVEVPKIYRGIGIQYLAIIALIF
jgi:hypothetical protein